MSNKVMPLTAGYSGKTDAFYCSVHELLQHVKSHDDLVSFRIQEYRTLRDPNDRTSGEVTKQRLLIASFTKK